MGRSTDDTAFQLNQTLQTHIAHGFTALHIALGDELGLFSILASEPHTHESLAIKANVNTRITYEWSEAMLESGYISLNSQKLLYLTDDQSLVLADDTSPLFFAGASKLLPGLANSYHQVLNTFRTGTGISRNEFSNLIWSGMWQMSGVWLRHMLVQSWIPQCGNTESKLRQNGTAAHLYCGDGTALRILANAFPNSSFTGIDPLKLAIDAATSRSSSPNSDNMHFACGNPFRLLTGTFDLILALDSLHDTPDLNDSLSRIANALEPGGAFLCLESNPDCPPSAGRTLLSSCSTFFSVPLEIHEDGATLGMLGLTEQLLQTAAQNCGLHFKRLPDPTPLNALYLMQKDA